MEKELGNIREQITQVDQSILELLANRRQLTMNVAKQKIIDKRPIRDSEREQDLLVRLIQFGQEKGLDAHFITQVFHGIIEDSVLNQQAFLQQQANSQLSIPLHRVAFLGAPGSYSYLATHKYFARRPGNVHEDGCGSFQEIIDKVESGTTDYGVLPIENTTSGSINEVFDVMQHTSVKIIGEVTHPIRHCLLAPSAIEVNKIRTLYAHPQVYAQCSHFLAELDNVKVEYCDSTSSAILKVSQSSDGCSAAIGSQAGGELYGLRAIKSDLANQKENHSRFIVVARKPVHVQTQVPAKTTFIMSVPQQPGALVEALLILREHNINMSKLESRPITGNPWEEMFYVDVIANVDSPDMQNALRALGEFTRFIKVLGCYPTETVMPTQVPSELLSPQNPIEKPTPAVSKSSITIKDVKFSSASFQVFPAPEAYHSVANLQASAKQIAASGGRFLVVPAVLPNDLTIFDYIDVARLLNLALIVSVANADTIKPALGKADAFIVDESKMQDWQLLTALGQSHRPVILQKNPNSSVDELLTAAHFIVEQGNQQVIICDTGSHALDNPQQSLIDIARLAELANHSPYLVMAALTLVNLPNKAIEPMIATLKAAGCCGVMVNVTDDEKSNAVSRHQYKAIQSTMAQ